MSTTAARTSTDRPATRTGHAAPVSIGPRIDPVRVLRQNQGKLIAALVVGVSLGGGAKVLFDKVYPLYNGTVLFELRPPLNDTKAFNQTEERTEEAVERLGQTESARLLSRALLETAMKNRDIENTEWSKKFRDETGQFIPEEAVDDLQDELSASHRRRTQYFSLSWSTNDPTDIPVVLNKIADTYLQVKRQADDKRFADNRRVFKDQLDALDNNLTAISRDISQFIRDHNITSLDANANELVSAMQDIGHNLGETQGQLSIAMSRKEQTKAKIDGQLAPSPEDVRKAEEHPVMLRLSTTMKDLRIGSEVAKQKFGPDHPEFKNAVRVFEAAEAERDIELKRIVTDNLHADYKSLSDQTQGLSRLLKEYQDDYAKNQLQLKEFSANLSELEEKRDLQRRLQESRSKTLDLVQEVDALKFREDARAVAIAQSAMTPREKSFPRWSVMIPLGGMLSVLLMLGWAFLREVMDQRIRYASDLSGMPARLLGTIPDVQDDPTGVKRIENAIREAPQSVVAESLRQTAAQIQKQLKAGGHRTVLLFGGMPAAGATAILTNLAETMASTGKRVLLVDANFRRPGLAVALGTDPNAPGFGEVLGGKTTVEKVTQQLAERIHFLNCGAPEQRVYERLATPVADEALAHLREMYDVVLIDAPPAVVAGDALVLAAKVDATVLVARAFQEQRGLVSRLVSQLHDSPSSFLGIILNGPRSSAGGYFRKNFEAMASYAGKP